MTENLLLNPRTKLQLEAYIKNPSGALLITGIAGSGKSTIAKRLSTTLLDAEDLDAHPYFLKLDRPKNKKDIPIENVREALSKLKLKIPGKDLVQRIVFIEDAHYLSIPAQNAILKALEEPNPGTIFILTATSTRSVLPTVASRTQQISIEPLGLSDVNSDLSDNYSADEIRRAWMLSGGAIGLLLALLSKEAEHPLTPAVESAKKFLRARKYERLILVDRTAKDREELMFFLEATTRSLNALHKSAIKNEKQAQSKALLAARKAVQKAMEAIEMSANTKLTALNLVINLKI